MTGISRVGVVGCGLMGSGVAEVAARAHLDVRVAVSSEASRAAGQRRIVRSLDRAVRAEKLTEVDRDAVLARITFTTDLTELADRQFVIESITEDAEAKIEVFGALDKIVEDERAILASNTSAIPIARLARATGRPESVVGTHFFSPAPVQPLVEIIASVLTDDSTCARAEAFLTEVLGKQVIRSPDRSGFVVNALLVPYLLGAVRMVESGFATPEIIDRGMELGCSYPMGPLRLCDLVGLDVLASASAALYAEFKEPLYAPPPLLSRMVDGGLHGRKTGRGFYRYT